MGNGKSVLKGISSFAIYIKKRKGVCFGEGNHYRNIWGKKFAADLLYNSMGKNQNLGYIQITAKFIEERQRLFYQRLNTNYLSFYLEDQGDLYKGKRYLKFYIMKKYQRVLIILFIVWYPV